jgi:hypothetical protein
LTDAQIEPVLAEIETSLARLDDANRREAAKSRDSFWQKRHAIAKEWVKQHPAPANRPRAIRWMPSSMRRSRRHSRRAPPPRHAAKTFHGEVLPILREQCFRCHGEKDKGGLKLNTREAAAASG